MATRKAQMRAAAVQEIGGAADEQQSDRIRAGEIRIASGDRVLLAVVADGSGPGGAEAAARLVEQVFQVVQASPPRRLATALSRGFEIADQSLRKAAGGSPGRPTVAATAAVIWRSRLYLAHVGNSCAVHVSAGRGHALTQPGAERLGRELPPQIVTGERQLRRGDRVVLCSDGLTRRDPETGAFFVALEEIAEHASQLAPSEAGRHLVSLALGRDVDDNVSVAVLALPGRASAERRFPWAAAVGGLALVAVVAAGAALLRQPTEPPTTDYGFAVLVEGGALADQGSGTPELVPNLGTIPAGSFLTAATNAQLGLQSTFSGASGGSQGNLYLDRTTGVELTAIDARPAGENPSPLGTDLTLVSGRLLVVRESGTWEFRVHSRGFTASLLGAGRGAIGVAANNSSYSLACLLGACRMMAPSGDPTLLSAGEFVSGAGSTLGTPSALTTAERAAWDQLCGECLAGR